MDFTSESYIFDPLQVDSSHIPIVNFSEYDEYPKRYINTQNPLGKKNEFVNMDNVEVKDIRNKLGLSPFSSNIRDNYSPEKIPQNIQKPSANVSRDNVMTRTATEGFADGNSGNSTIINLFSNKIMFHLFLIIFITLFVILLSQAFTMYSQNKLLKSMIKFINTKKEQ